MSKKKKKGPQQGTFILVAKSFPNAKKKKMVTYKDHSKALLSLLQRVFQMSKTN